MRAPALFLIALLTACWAWVIVMALDMYGPMTGASSWMMTMRWDEPHLLLLWAMWAAMMAGMMLPAATPILMMYGMSARRTGSRQSAADVYLLAAGYVAVWALFSIAATAIQRALARALVLTPMMEPATATASGVLLLIAGVYQLTPLKRVCLRSCRSPLSFITQHWRPGAGGAFRMGVEHGVYCVGCCWALMLLLFAGGVMNLAVILALTAWVIVEKVAPFGERSAQVVGVLLLAGGVWMVVR